MSDKIDNQLADQLKAILEAGISDDVMEKVKKQTRDLCSDIEDDLLYRVKSDLADNLSSWVAELAGRAVNSLLEGNESMMRQYLSCSEYGYNGRSGEQNLYGQRDIAAQHPVIHGTLFEQGCVKLRKDITTAHRALLVSERILDLEDHVKSLVAQLNKANAEKDAMWERVHSQ